MKKIVSIVLSITLVCCMTVHAAACEETIAAVSNFMDRVLIAYETSYEDEVTLNGIKDVARFVGQGNAENNGVIGIASLKNTEGYIVTLSGTKIGDENAGIKEDILSAFNQSNEYKNSAISAIIENIPDGSDIYIYGVSLGGMVLQQVISDNDIKNNYNIKVAVAIGSPITAVNRQPIVFIEDVNDIVPNLSVLSTMFKWIFNKYDTHIRANGGYDTPIGAHVLSYVESSVWDNIDAFGRVNGNNNLIVDFTTFNTYKA